MSFRLFLLSKYDLCKTEARDGRGIIPCQDSVSPTDGGIMNSVYYSLLFVLLSPLRTSTRHMRAVHNFPHHTYEM